MTLLLRLATLLLLLLLLLLFLLLAYLVQDGLQFWFLIDLQWNAFDDGRLSVVNVFAGDVRRWRWIVQLLLVVRLLP